MIPFAIGAIFQNEAPYLREWIEFHLLVGCSFFYLFDHQSTDHPETILRPYIEQNKVQLTRWPFSYSDVHEWTQVQCLAYERAIFQAKGKVSWLALLDIDEFFFSPKGNLLEILPSFSDYGGIAVNWQTFGTSHLSHLLPDRPMIEQLIWKAPTEHITNHYIKSIVQPHLVEKAESAHHFSYQQGHFHVNEKKNPFSGCISPSVEVDFLRIHHYTLRDEDYFQNIKRKRLEKWWPNWQTRPMELNQVEDRTIHRFFPLYPR